jgi:hypothetical protein
VRAFQFLLGPDTGGAEKAKDIALGESFNSHEFARDLIVAVASERDHVVAALLKEKAAAEKAGTPASRKRVRDASGAEGAPDHLASLDAAAVAP